MCRMSKSTSVQLKATVLVLLVCFSTCALYIWLYLSKVTPLKQGVLHKFELSDCGLHLISAKCLAVLFFRDNFSKSICHVVGTVVLFGTVYYPDSYQSYDQTWIFLCENKLKERDNEPSLQSGPLIQSPANEIQV